MSYADVGVLTDPLPVHGPLLDAWTDPAIGQGPFSHQRVVVPTGPEGHVIIKLGTYAPGLIKTLSLQIHAPGCVTTRVSETPVMWRVGQVDSDTIRLEVEGPSALALAFPVATLDTGQKCASGVHAFGRDVFSLFLRVDSIIHPRFYGRWWWAPNRTDSGEWGPFAGTKVHDVLVIDLVIDGPFNRCEGTRLTIQLAPDGQWLETNVTSSLDCLGESIFFTFGAGEFHIRLPEGAINGLTPRWSSRPLGATDGSRPSIQVGSTN